MREDIMQEIHISCFSNPTAKKLTAHFRREKRTLKIAQYQNDQF